MAVNKKPFDDVRVRQAFRFIANREEMVQQAVAGLGTVGHDIYSPYDPCYASDLATREQDIEQAKSLLKQAGQEGMTVELVVAPVSGGIVEAAQVFAEQAKQAGVNVKLRKVDTGVLWPDFTPDEWPFTVSFWGSYSYLTQASFSEGPDASWRDTGFNDPEFNRLLAAATAELDDDRRCEIQHEMQAIQYERGGFLVWSFVHAIAAHSNKVAGFVTKDETGDSLGRAAQLHKVHFV